MTQTAVNADERVRALIEITQSLTTIFGKENTILRTGRPREMEPLQAEKARLAAAYASSIRDVAQDRGAVADADGALLTELRAITRTFEARAAEQKALLEGAQQATSGVLKSVAAEAAAARDAAGYDPNKSAGTGDKAAPIAINERA